MTSQQTTLKAIGIEPCISVKRTEVIFIDGRWSACVFECEHAYSVKESKRYQIWVDSVGRKFWVILDQQLNVGIDFIDCCKIIDYSQRDNWIVECYSIVNGMCITRYYPHHLPLIPSSESYDLLFKSLSRDWPARHGEYFTPERRQEFHQEAIRQHEAFSDATGLYFSDIQPNNFMANREFGEPKIVDFYSLKPGNIKTDYVDPFEGCEDTWPLPDSRTVGRYV